MSARLAFCIGTEERFEVLRSIVASSQKYGELSRRSGELGWWEIERRLALQGYYKRNVEGLLLISATYANAFTLSGAIIELVPWASVADDSIENICENRYFTSISFAMFRQQIWKNSHGEHWLDFTFYQQPNGLMGKLRVMNRKMEYIIF